jgi:hypothetical protein
MRLSPCLVPGSQFNPNGHFEDEEILVVHESILTHFERSWDTLAAIQPFPAQWWQSRAMDSFRDALVDIVQRRRAEGPGIWGFKDPRIASLMPLWNDVFRICCVRPIFVLCLRHPAAVARSLAARDGLSSLFSELLWFEKTLTGCLAIQDSPHCLIQYEEWFKDPLPQIQMLCKLAGLALDGLSWKLNNHVASIIDFSLRHEDGGDVQSSAVRNFYAYLTLSPVVPVPEVLKRFESAYHLGRDFIAAGGLTLCKVYSPNVAGYSEERSSTYPLTAGEVEYAEFCVPSPSGRLRLDPCNCACMVQISDIVVECLSTGAIMWRFDPVRLDEIDCAGTAMRIPDEGRLILFSHGYDPQLYLPLLESLDPDQAVRVRCWLRIDRDFSAIAVALGQYSAARAEVAGLRSSLDRAGVEMSRLSGEVLDLRIDCRSQVQHIADLIVELGRLSQQLLEERRRSNLQMDSLRASYQSALSERAALKQSLSWRITAPFRYLAEVLRLRGSRERR